MIRIVFKAYIMSGGSWNTGQLLRKAW